MEIKNFMKGMLLFVAVALFTVGLPKEARCEGFLNWDDYVTNSINNLQNKLGNDKPIVMKNTLPKNTVPNQQLIQQDSKSEKNS